MDYICVYVLVKTEALLLSRIWINGHSATRGWSFYLC